MADTFRLEIVTPERLFYDGQVEMVIVRTLSGDEGFMANHAWACKLLNTGELWLKEEGSRDYRVAAISGGFIDVKTETIIFTDSAEWPDEIDVERSKSHKETAEKFLKSHKEKDTEQEEWNHAKISLLKAVNRMLVAEGGVIKRK
jgi:F-type H+-transporting ATPase subunit epsilon